MQNCITIQIGNKKYTLETQSFSKYRNKIIEVTSDGEYDEMVGVIAKVDNEDIATQINNMLSETTVYTKEDLRTFINNNLESKTKKVAKNFLEEIISTLEDSSDNITITVHNYSAFSPRVEYYYDFVNGKSVLTKNIQLPSDATEKQVLHELMHSYFDAILSNRNHPLYSDLVDFMKEVVKIDAVNNKYENLKEYLQNNKREFIPILFENSTFIKEVLNKEKIGDKTILTTLIDIIGKNKEIVRGALQSKKSEEYLSEDDGDILIGLTSFSKTGGEDIFVPKSLVADDVKDITDKKKRIRKLSQKITENYLKNIFSSFAELKRQKSLSFDQLIERSKKAYKKLNVFYNKPIYRIGFGAEGQVEKDNDVFNYYLDIIEEEDLVKIPYMKWNGKEWEIVDNNKHIWVPVLYSIPEAGLIKVAKPYKTEKDGWGGTMTIPYKFIRGIRTLAGEMKTTNINVNSPKSIHSVYGYSKNKKSDYYISFKLKDSDVSVVAPSFNKYSILSAKQLTDEDDKATITLKDAAESTEVVNISNPNTDLIRTLREGDLVRVKMTTTYKGIKKEWNLWKPVRNVGANGVEIVVGENENSLYYADMKDISMVAILKERDERRLKSMELVKKKITSNKGKEFEVYTLSEDRLKIFVGAFDNLDNYNKHRAKYGASPITKEEADKRKQEMLLTIKPGDYVEVGIEINNKRKKTLRKVVAVSPKKVYLAANKDEGEGNTIFSANLNEVSVIYKDVKEDVRNLKVLKEAFELVKEGQYKDKKHFNNRYIIENVYQDRGLAQFGKLKKGDIVATEYSTDEDSIKLVYKVVTDVTEKGVIVATTYGKEITSENIRYQVIPFENIVEVGYKSNKALEMHKKELDAFRKLAKLGPLTFSSIEKANNYLKANKGKPFSVNENLELEYIFKDGRKIPVKGLRRNYKFIPSKYVKKQLTGITRSNKRLLKGDIVKKKGSDYYSLVKSVIFDKNGDFYGVRVAGGGDNSYFTTVIKKKDIVGLGYSEWLYSERVAELYEDLDLQKHESIRSRNLKSKNSYFKSKPEDIKLLQELSNRLTKLNPGIEVRLVNNAEMEELGYKDTRGFVDGNIVYINTDLASRSDLLHEFGHILMRLVQIENNDLYNRIVQEALNSPLYDHFKSLYPELSEQQLGEEIFISALDNDIRDKAFPPKTKTWWDKLTNLINSFFDAIKSGLSKLFGGKDLFKGINNYTLMRTDLNTLVELFGDKILNETIQPSITNSVSKQVFDLGINTSYMNEEQIKRLKEVINSRVCLN